MSMKVADVGKQEFLSRDFSVNTTLHLFKNNYTPVDGSTLANFTEATFTGYAAITLTGGSWTLSIPSGGTAQAAYAQQVFASTANQTAQVIYGYYVVDVDGTTLLFAELFSSSVTIQNNGDAIKVTPQYQRQDM